MNSWLTQCWKKNHRSYKTHSVLLNDLWACYLFVYVNICSFHIMFYRACPSCCMCLGFYNKHQKWNIFPIHRDRNSTSSVFLLVNEKVLW